MLTTNFFFFCIGTKYLYHFICGPRDRNVFPKWPARLFGLATPATQTSRVAMSDAALRVALSMIDDGLN
jgi:hypothetical protein